MRCTRCDRPAVPQAIGWTPEGRLVFGWCLACLEESGCTDVVVARPNLRPARVPLPRLRGRAPGGTTVLKVRPLRPEAGRAAGDDRRRLLGAVGLTLALWGTILVLGGLFVRARAPSGPPSPHGNGTPALLLVGGGAVVALGLGFWARASGYLLLRSRPALKAVQAVGFAAALVVLGAGVLARSPRRGPLVVAVAAAALAVSAVARRAETRRFGPSARDRPD